MLKDKQKTSKKGSKLLIIKEIISVPVQRHSPQHNNPSLESTKK